MSVVVPTHNSAEYVEETLRSILCQDYSDFEIVVTDDASSDGTVELLTALARSEPRIRFYRNPVNKGAARTRNRCIKEAVGRFVAFCDADDLWVPGKLSKQVTFMLQRKASISFTAYDVIDRKGSPTGTSVDLRGPATVDYEDMLRKRATMGCSTVIVDRAATGPFSMPDLRTGQDYATWLHILREGHVAHCLEESLTRYRITPGSISRNKFRKARRQWEIYRGLEDLGFLKASWCFLNYAYRAVFRR